MYHKQLKTISMCETNRGVKLKPGRWNAETSLWLRGARVSECGTNFSILVSKLDAQRVHGSKNGCQALDGVAVDHRLVLLHIIPGESIFVYNPARARRH